MTGESEDIAPLAVFVPTKQLVGTSEQVQVHCTSAPQRKRILGLVGILLLTVLVSDWLEGRTGWLEGRTLIHTLSTTTRTSGKSETAPLSLAAANITRFKADKGSEVGWPSDEQFDDLKPKLLHSIEGNVTVRSSSSSGDGAFDHGLKQRIPKRSPHHAYQCGFLQATTILNSVFPETNATILAPELHEEMPRDELFRSFQSDDVLLVTCRGPCIMPYDELLPNFPGSILMVVGEPDVDRCHFSSLLRKKKTEGGSGHMGRAGPGTKKRVAFVTRVGSDRDRWNESTYNVALLISGNEPSARMRFYQPEMRPRGTGKHFLIYANSDCVPYREEAFRRLAAIGPDVHYVGKCHGGRAGVGVRVNDTENRKGYGVNERLYHDYRFTLAMEKAAVTGYISEKIMMPLLAGSVPIYFGTTEVFDVFNRNAFVWYDVKDPQPALDQIKYLEANRTAYEEMLRQPILASGEETIAKYFSIRDEDGGGRLKWAIRDRMGFG